MKIGGFGKIGDYQEISKAGYDFAELDMPEIEELTEKEFEKLCKEVEECGFQVLTGARLFPITEPTFLVAGFSPSALISYLEKVCKRTSMLGIRKLILGNGKARSLQVPEDIQKEPLFIEMLKTIADIAKNNGQELILEPLGPKYSNYINTIPEAVSIIKKVDKFNVFTMADLRHMVGNEEPFDHLVKYVSYIHHIHIDYPKSYPEREYPSLTDDYDYSEFLSALKESGYDDTITIEADVPDDWKAAYRKVKEVLKRYLLLF